MAGRTEVILLSDFLQESVLAVFLFKAVGINILSCVLTIDNNSERVILVQGYPDRMLSHRKALDCQSPFLQLK